MLARVMSFQALRSSHALYDENNFQSMRDNIFIMAKQIDKGLYPRAFCKIIPDLLAGDEGKLFALKHRLSLLLTHTYSRVGACMDRGDSLASQKLSFGRIVFFFKKTTMDTHVHTYIRT
jgi:hypothetical protein